MSMVVIASHTVCCTDCGGFHFLANDKTVTHPDGEMYQWFDGKEHHPCPNIGKKFKITKPPTLCEEVEV